jgi:hypothetical protein
MEREEIIDDIGTVEVEVAGLAPSWFRRLGRLRRESTGHVTLSIDGRHPIDADVVRLLDHVGARLTAALAGPVGGRVAVRVVSKEDQVVLDVGSARPGSWSRALERRSFDDLLADVSRLVEARRGTLALAEEPFGRLRATVRISHEQGHMEGGLAT